MITKKNFFMILPAFVAIFSTFTLFPMKQETSAPVIIPWASYFIVDKDKDLIASAAPCRHITFYTFDGNEIRLSDDIYNKVCAAPEKALSTTAPKPQPTSCSIQHLPTASGWVILFYDKNANPITFYSFDSESQMILTQEKSYFFDAITGSIKDLSFPLDLSKITKVITVCTADEPKKSAHRTCCILS
jgi:hypothetical protein